MKLAVIVAFYYKLTTKNASSQILYFSNRIFLDITLVRNKYHSSTIVTTINSISWELDRSCKHLQLRSRRRILVFRDDLRFSFRFYDKGQASKLAIPCAALPRSVPFSFSDITVGGLYVRETGPAACFYASQCTLSFCNEKIYTNPP